jgi:hypothetical protein
MNNRNSLGRDPLTIHVRTFVPPSSGDNLSRKFSFGFPMGASKYTLVIDTETTVDAAQKLRIAAWQWHEDDESAPKPSGFVYNPKLVTGEDLDCLQRYANAHKLSLLTQEKFIDSILYRKAYDVCSSTVGLNLPFDISRFAIRHNSAHGRTKENGQSIPGGNLMRGGFTFQLSKSKRRPNVQIKHLSARAALKQFTKPPKNTTSRGMRKRGLKVKARGASLIELKTLAAALTDQSFTLATLADFLQTPHRKQSVDAHGGL